MSFDMSEMAPGPMRLERNSDPVCKVDGCENPVVNRHGPGAMLCAEHRPAKPARPARKVQRPATANGTVAAVLTELRAELHVSQQRIDRLIAAIAALEGLDP